MTYRRQAVGDLPFRCCLQVGHGGLTVEIGDDEPAEQACMGAARSDDLDRGLWVLRYLGQVVELASHDLAAADGAVQDCPVTDDLPRRVGADLA